MELIKLLIFFVLSEIVFFEPSMWFLDVSEENRMIFRWFFWFGVLIVAIISKLKGLI